MSKKSFFQTDCGFSRARWETAVLFLVCMLFRFDLYPAELLKEILEADRKGHNVVEGIKSMLYGLIINDLADVPDDFIGTATAMLDNANRRSRTYRANAMKRDYSKKPESDAEKTEESSEVSEEAEDTKQAQNARKEPKVAIDMAGFVMVTEREYDSLRERFGQDLPEMVEILSAYKESTGKKYKSDAGAIRGWVKRVFEERKRKQGAKSFQQSERERNASITGTLLTDEERSRYGL